MSGVCVRAPSEKCVNWVIISFLSEAFLSLRLLRPERARHRRFSLFVWRAKNLPFSERAYVAGKRQQQLVCPPLVISFWWRCQMQCDIYGGNRSIRAKWNWVDAHSRCARSTAARMQPLWAMRTHTHTHDTRDPSKSNSGSFSRRWVTDASERETTVQGPHLTHAVISADRIMVRGFLGQLTICIA